MDRLFTHIQFSSADASSPTALRFSALCHLHRFCVSVCRLCIFYQLSEPGNKTGQNVAACAELILCYSQRLTSKLWLKTFMAFLFMAIYPVKVASSYN